jgi:ketosteroid isomerase-like protein
MRRDLRAMVVLGGMLAAGACAQAPEPNAASDIAAVTAVRSGFATALNNGDAVAIGNAYTATAVSMHNHDKTVTGRDAIIESQKAMFSQFSVKAEITGEDTKTFGDVGYDRGRYKMALTPKAGGDPVIDEGRYIVLLEKDASGAWKLTADMDNSVTPLPMPPTGMAMPPAK